MHKVLIITYYWPPCGGSAVLRWLKFAKYLREYGWEPVIYTPSNPEPQEYDPSLLNDIPENIRIIRSKIREPYSAYKRITGRSKHEKLGVGFIAESKKRGFLDKFALWIRSNLFIPDPRVFWVNPSVKLLTGFLQQNPVTMVITSGPPHSMHLIGLKLKKKTGIKWIADFRDPWTNIDFYTDLTLTAWADRKHKQLENMVLSEANHVISVSPTMSRELQSMGAQNITTITNGFDKSLDSGHAERGGKFTLMHLGSIPYTRNPENLWQVLSEITGENKQFDEALEIILAGKTDYRVKENLGAYSLEKYVQYRSYLPHYNALEAIGRSQVLLLLINNTPNARGILTNKFFEYLSVQRHILAIGPSDGDAAKILSETAAGQIFDFRETKSLKQHLLALFDLYSHNKLITRSNGLDKYHRKNLTRDLAQLLNNISS